MTEKKQLNIRVDSMTRQHIEDLVEQTGLSKPEVLMLAIDRLWMQEFDITRTPIDFPKYHRANPEYDGPQPRDLSMAGYVESDTLDDPAQVITHGDHNIDDEPDPALAEWRHIKERMKAPDGF